MTSIDFLLKCLDVIERRESNLLVWGVVDLAYTKYELEELIDPTLDKAMQDGLDDFILPGDVIQALLDNGFLHTFDENDEPRYRSRMAETIRLINRLRQLFHNRHGGTSGWQTGATLVADYRFICRKRKYPKRNLTSSNILDVIKAIRGSTQHLKIIELFLNHFDEGFKLSGFQVRATKRILEGLIQKENKGTIVCAGTGSGKTLAFYMPALAHIAARIQSDSSGIRWVKALAIYPRNELLKDQFSEVYAEARSLNTYLVSQGKRKLQIGAFFGPTPKKAESLSNTSPGWSRCGGGYRCQYLRCPSKGCRGDLVWTDEDRSKNLERLKCSACGHIILDDEIILTRSRLMETPPDILFTSTEMMNQRMTDSMSRHLFGLGSQVQQGPDMVLFDEVHTYAGMHGAQVSYLLRRWKKAIQKNVVFVGLSATLKDAAKFFANLTGLPELYVEEISAKSSELESEGAEYMLTLRGDPVSQTSLLSTTIQTAMLGTRALDPRNAGKSNGVYGSKTFLFTDDIDVTNRLFFSVLDAEGRDSWGNQDLIKYPDGGLAVLRRSAQNQLRYKYGQDWEMCERLGHDLSQRLIVGRTSSQDSGVDTSADIVIATASLEVGYNDPEVGAVIQHKAPRDMAQFIQRKGRAGRSRNMRPWTIVVLSDYGRDRIAYQNYEHLFDPELDPKHLPLSNRYIQRMQAVYALLDYLVKRVSSSRGKCHIWRDLSGPGNDTSRKIIIQELTMLLESDQALSEFTDYLSRALRLDGDSISSIMWEHPRPLMTTVIPTALRRLKSNWRCNNIDKSDYSVFNSPLPEFAPPNLFSDLNLPEVKIILPQGNEKEFETMPVMQAMREYAPGRVSRRYGVRHKYERHWLVPDDVAIEDTQAMDVNAIGKVAFSGDYTFIKETEKISMPVYRVLELILRKPVVQINDTSNARLIWHTQIETPQVALKMELPENSGWNKIIEEIEFCLHNHHTPVEVRRFSCASKASVSYQSGEKLDASFTFQMNEKEVGIGYSLLVDGMRFKINTPKNLWESDDYQNDKWRSLRRSRYFDMAWNGEKLSSIGNPFARDWLAQIYISALTYQAHHNKSSLKDAEAAISEGGGMISFTEVLDAIFQSSRVAEEGDVVIEEDKLRQSLLLHLQNQSVINELKELSSCLWDPVDSSWDKWLNGKYKATLAAGIYTAVQNLVPDLDTESLIVDIDHYSSTEESLQTQDIWITESSIGGCGLIEALIEQIGEDPRRFFNLVSAALRPSEHEIVDTQLIHLLKLMKEEDSTLGHNIAKFRTGSDVKSLETAFKGIRGELMKEGFTLFHAFLSSLNNRILKPGSSYESDSFLRDALDFWSAQEQELGIELDSRIVSYLISKQDREFNFIANDAVIEHDVWKFNTIYGMLWARGSALRQSTLSVYNPFHDFPKTERLLVLDTLDIRTPEVDVTSANWQERCLQSLGNSGVVNLLCPSERRVHLSKALNFLMTNPIEDDYMVLYPRLRGFHQDIKTLSVHIELAEAVQ